MKKNKMRKALLFPEILNLDEASQFLRVGKKTLSNLAKKGKVPARKIGREWRFVKSILFTWLSQGGGKLARSRWLTAYRLREIGQFPEESLQPLYLENIQKLKTIPKK